MARNQLKTNNDLEFPIEIIRTDRRKTFSIKIDKGKVRIVVPKRLSQKNINAIILKKTPWIRKKIRLQEKIYPLKPKEYVNGETFSYLGKGYRLKLVENGIGEARLKRGELVLGVSPNLKNDQKLNFVKSRIVQWYKTHAEKILRDKTKKYARKLRLHPKSISVKEYKSRWGSCSIKGEIIYNWKIVLAPKRIVDYVIIHELCHLLHQNHSPEFWRTVENSFLSYKESRQWLKENGSTLYV